MEEGEDRAKAEGIMFIETSAKGGYNIKVRTKSRQPLTKNHPNFQPVYVHGLQCVISGFKRVAFVAIFFFSFAFLYELYTGV